MRRLGALSLLKTLFSFGAWRKLKGSLSDISFESGETVFEGRGLFGAIAALHDAFSRLRVLTV
jgi:hypothetical protein